MLQLSNYTTSIQHIKAVISLLSGTILVTRQPKAPARLVPARGTAHKECLMDEPSVTRESHHTAPRCHIALLERANGTTALDGEGIQAWLEWEWEATRC